MKFGIVVYCKPESVDFDLACKISLEALNEKHEVSLFLMVDGVRGATDPRIERIIEKGGNVILCEYNADLKKSEKGKVKSGSQYDLAEIVKTCDRFLAFT